MPDQQESQSKLSDLPSVEDAENLETAEFGHLLKRDVEEAKDESSRRLATEKQLDVADSESIDGEQFQLMRPPSKNLRR